MIIYSLVIFFVVSTIVFISFINIKTNKFYNKKKIIRISFLAFSLAIVCNLFYFKLSNFWLGNSIIDKISLQTNIKNQGANEIALIQNVMLELEEKLNQNPNNIEVILKLAEVRFLLGYFNDALILYKKARSIVPNNLEIINSEIKVRLVIEKSSPSKETIGLLEDLLIMDSKNLLALYVLGDYAYNNNDFIKANEIFNTLQALLKKDSKEYDELKKKILKIENKKNEN